MPAPVQTVYHARPSVPGFMFSAFLPSPGLAKTGGFPDMDFRWLGHRLESRQAADFAALTGLAPTGLYSVLHPQTTAFALKMALLTHRAFPEPIWRNLQIRNHLLLRRPIPIEASLDLRLRIAAWRVLEKGVEIDLHLSAALGTEVAWESLDTFYIRGRYGAAGAPSPWAEAPAPGDGTIATWTMPSDGRLAYGRLTGDYNGIHLADGYARLFGFAGAFFHPQRVLGQVAAHLKGPGPDKPQRFDAWLKGPVPYGASVKLVGGTEAFALLVGDAAKPAILGAWREVGPDHALVDASGAPSFGPV